ncbi:MAG: phospholipase D-like domain-containing protein [Marmoricola sp.]
MARVPHAPLINTSHPIVRALRKIFFGLFGAQLGLAVGLTLVDSYRRRGKRPQPFPITPPQDVPMGPGSVRTYTFGSDLYADMIAAIDQAQKRVLLETYIWKGDDVGERFKAALTRASARGVEVYVIYDSFANLVVSPRFKHFSPRLRVMAYPIYNAGWRFWDLRRYGRDHRKILVVDDQVAFVGGYNIGAPFATEWRDTHCRITGPGVWDLARAFADFWNTQRHVHSRWRASHPPLLLDASPDWEPHIRVHRNLPKQWTFPIRSMYLEAIDRAHRNVWLTHAYFMPDENFVHALTEAARRGVDVRLLLPRTSNHVVADWLSRGYFSQLLGSGVRIFRFTGAMVHAKTATIDGRWSTIGTANIDRLSMTGNYEINVEFIDPLMAGTMEEIFTNDLTNAVELSAEQWAARGFQSRFTEAVLGPLRPLL